MAQTATPRFRRAQAMNAQWVGVLRLSTSDNTAMLEGTGATARYALSPDGVLTMNWDRYEPEVFVEWRGRYVAKALLDQAPSLDHLFAVRIGDQPVMASRVHLLVGPRRDYEVGVRLDTTDSLAFTQIFVDHDYESPNLPQDARTIVDLGANVGFATVFFGLRYPAARILAVEPDQANFDALSANVAALGERVLRQHAAVWSKDGVISLDSRDDAGRPLGDWERRTTDRISPASQAVASYRLNTLLDIARFDTVDILKVDIEGAELELFSQDPAQWLPRIGLIMVETHDRFRPGAEWAVRSAIHAQFEELPRSGENLMFRRRR